MGEKRLMDQAASPKEQSARRLTAAQAGMLFESLAQPTSGVYFAEIAAILDRSIDLDQFRAAWGDVIARHDALRSTFGWNDEGAPVQIVHAGAPNEVWTETLVGPETPENHLAAIRRAPFDPSDFSALGLHLFRRDNGDTTFLWRCHHALIDDWSASLVLEDVDATYRAHASGIDFTPQTAGSYAAFSDWLNDRNSGAAKTHWRQRFSKFDEPTRLPFPKPQNSNRRPETHQQHQFELTSEETARLTAAARTAGVPLASLVTTAWGLMLRRVADRKDIAFGVAASQRAPEIPDIENAIGNFVTVLPTRLNADNAASVEELVVAAADCTFEDMEHAHLSLGEIGAVNNFSADTSLFDTIVSIESNWTNTRTREESVFQEISVRDQSHYSVSLLAFPGDRFSFRVQFDQKRLDTADAKTMGDLYKTVLVASADKMRTPAASLQQLPAAMQSRIDAALTGPAPVFHLDSVEQAFEAWADKTPDAPALITSSDSLTYKELNELAECWAHAIVHELNERAPKRQPRIAIVSGRSKESIAAMLGALKAGAAYIPIDSASPRQRLQTILEDCGPDIIIADENAAHSLQSISAPILLLSRSPTPLNRQQRTETISGDLAYILYTSGSSGKPKGVAVSRNALAYSTASRNDFYDTPPKAFLLLSPLFFDSSVAGLFWTLTSGGALVLPGDDEITDIKAISSLVRRSSASHTLGVPAFLTQLCELSANEDLASLNTVIAAGEALQGDAATRIMKNAPGRRLYNEYGPTEATVWCAVHEYSGDASSGSNVPIGRPIPGARLFIRDNQGRDCPPNIPGELFVAGPGLASGYVNDNGDAIGGFKNDPRAPDGKIYATGDRVRLDHNGNIHFLGRMDRQFKRAGRRIDPTEIEAALLAIEGVNEAYIKIDRTESRPKIVAFVAGEINIDDVTIRAALSDQLPDWMTPDTIHRMDTLPRNARGKIDSEALKAPAKSARTDPKSLSETERRLASIWRQALSANGAIGPDDNFFALGGDSLIAMRLLHDIEKAFGQQFPFSLIGRLSTLRSQASAIERHLRDDERALNAGAPHTHKTLLPDEIETLRSYTARWPGSALGQNGLVRILNKNGRKRPLVWCFNDAFEFRRLASRLGRDQPIYGFRSGNLVLDMSPASHQTQNNRVAETIVSELLHVLPDRPIVLGGNCQGAAIALDIALAFSREDKAVERIILMEATPRRPFGGNVTFIFGKRSALNPFNQFADPETGLRKYFPKATITQIPGGHGDYFRRLTIHHLARAIKSSIQQDNEGVALSPDINNPSVHGKAFSWPDRVHMQAFHPGETRTITLTCMNNGSEDWAATTNSGLLLINRWKTPDGEVTHLHDGAAPISSVWKSGAAMEFEITVTAPKKTGSYLLEFDLAENGVAMFSDYGAPVYSVEATVEATRPHGRRRPNKASKEPSALNH
ncbi:MAG: amino acid adenylation domain-containing protein [Pseudomonadota bacterium]